MIVHKQACTLILFLLQRFFKLFAVQLIVSVYIDQRAIGQYVSLPGCLVCKELPMSLELCVHYWHILIQQVLVVPEERR
jgi:hypothetical protein